MILLPQLASKFYPPDSALIDACPLVLIHGLFGSGDNWAPVARLLARTRPVLTLDLPAHDGSKNFPSALDYPSLSEVVIRHLQASVELSSFEKIDVLGHSMGGKVAMTMALLRYKKLRRLIVADIAPKTYEPHHQHIFAALEAVHPEKLQNRSQADAIFARYVDNSAERAFLGWNLRSSDQGGYQWRFDLERIEAAYHDILGFPIIEASLLPSDLATLFIKGSLSSYLADPEDRPLLAKFFTNFSITCLEQAGHWVHVDKRAEFALLVEQFLV